MPDNEESLPKWIKLVKEVLEEGSPPSPPPSSKSEGENGSQNAK